MALLGVLFCGAAVLHRRQALERQEQRLLHARTGDMELSEWHAKQQTKHALDRAAAGGRASDKTSRMGGTAFANAMIPDVSGGGGDARFLARALVFGRMTDAAKGVVPFMNVSRQAVLAAYTEGLVAIRREFELLVTSAREHGDAEAIEVAERAHECMEYVLDGAAGSSPLRAPRSKLPRDSDERGRVRPDRIRATDGKPMRLADFVQTHEAQTAGLEEMHVAALRIYTTAAFEVVNGPLRDTAERRQALMSDRDASERPHPLPLTTWLIADAIPRLWSVEASKANANVELDLYRGVAHAVLSADLFAAGGTEIGLMSTTTSLPHALAQSGALLRIRTRSPAQRGADMRFLSAFPSEKEYLLPPLTYLEPLSTEEIAIGGKKVTVLYAEPVLCVAHSRVA